MSGLRYACVVAIVGLVSCSGEDGVSGPGGNAEAGAPQAGDVGERGGSATQRTAGGTTGDGADGGRDGAGVGASGTGGGAGVGASEGGTTDVVPVDEAGSSFGGNASPGSAGAAEMDGIAGAAGAGGANAGRRSRIYFVRAGAPEGGDGTSWSEAYANLWEPLFDASAGDQIWVATGKYRPAGDRQNYYPLKQGVAVYGGFDGVNDKRLSDRDPVANETILDGDLGDNDQPPGRGQGIFDDSRVLVRADNTGPTAVLDGFTLQYDSMGYPEGTLDIFGEAPLLRNLKLRFRTFGTGGGLAFHGVATQPVVYENLIFEDNDQWGIMIDGSVDFTCLRCSFKGNKGALEVAGDWYGPVKAKLVDSDIEATSEYEPGPGPHVEFYVRGPADVTLQGCRIHGRPDQSIAYVQNGALHFVDTVISGYTTAYQPYNSFIQLSPQEPDTLTSLDFVSSTVFGTGTVDGTLFQIFDGGPVRLRIYNSVLSNPTKQFDLWPGADPTIETSHSALPGVTGPGNIAGDPKLDAQGHPLPGSPLIDAGIATVPDNLLADSGDLDRDGNTSELLPLDAARAKRFVDYPPLSSATIDIGAFEASP